MISSFRQAGVHRPARKPLAMSAWRTVPHLALIAAALPFGVQASAEDPLPERETSLVVYGNDACPKPRDSDEVVVCARRPEEERYRIPQALRQRPDHPAEVSWGSRSAQLEDAQRDTRPDSCSVVGSFGQSGCQAALVRQWYAERRGH
jgi:hypothetical protein